MIQSNIHWSHVSIHQIIRTHWLARHEYIAFTLAWSLESHMKCTKRMTTFKIAPTGIFKHIFNSSINFGYQPLLLKSKLPYLYRKQTQSKLLLSQNTRLLSVEQSWAATRSEESNCRAELSKRTASLSSWPAACAKDRNDFRYIKMSLCLWSGSIFDIFFSCPRCTWRLAPMHARS